MKLIILGRNAVSLLILVLSLSCVVLAQSALTDDIARRETGAEPIQCTVSYEPTHVSVLYRQPKNLPDNKGPSRQQGTFPTTRDLPDNQASPVTKQPLSLRQKTKDS
jgi:hypothetical protein